MENFVVSARKYRPATFDSVVGQGSITSTLKNSIKNNHLAQAFLFTGPRGVGKTTCARIFAKTINCTNLNDAMEPCDECQSCISFNQSNSFNVHELDAASNNSVEDIRRLVEQVRIPPQVGNYKVYIIDEVHMLSQAAFNAFLKTLEEPPAYAKFILATTEKHKIIPTILSRCQIYDFNRITVKDIADYLAYIAGKEGVIAEEEALLVMAQKADGAMRDALSIFDQIVSYTGKDITYRATIENLNVLDVEYYFQLVELFLRGDISGSLVIFNDVVSKGFDGLHFINGLSTHLRNILVGKDQQTIALLETSDGIKSQYAHQAAKCDLRFLVYALDLSTAVDLSYKMASDKRLLIELNLMKMCKLNHPFAAVEATAIEKKKSDEISSTATTTIQESIKQQAKPIPATVTAPIPEKEAPKKIAESTPPEKSINAEQSINTPTQETVASEPEISNISQAEPSPARVKRTRGISILQSMSEAKVEPEKVNLEDALGQKFEVVEKNISTEDFSIAIEKYIQLISKEKPAFASAIQLDNIDFLPNNEVLLNLNNTAMDDTELKYNLLFFLKKELDNQQIQLSTIIQEAKIEAQATSMDLYNKMVEKNPLVDKLREQLDLDFM